MDDLISRQAAVDALGERPMIWSDGDEYAIGEQNQYDSDKLALETVPSVDAVEVVRCGECKYRKVNEHYGEKGYMKLKAICKLDTGDPFGLGRNAEDENWFCADGKREEDG